MLRDKETLLDIIVAVQKGLQYTQNIDRDILQKNDEKQAAVLYRIIIVGEATKRLSAEFREKYKTIPWKEMAGMRDVVIHDYDKIDFEILWNVIHINFPEILPELQAILNKL